MKITRLKDSKRRGFASFAWLQLEFSIDFFASLSSPSLPHNPLSLHDAAGSTYFTLRPSYTTSHSLQSYFPSPFTPSFRSNKQQGSESAPTSVSPLVPASEPFFYSLTAFTEHLPSFPCYPIPFNHTTREKHASPFIPLCRNRRFNPRFGSSRPIIFSPPSIRPIRETPERRTRSVSLFPGCQGRFLLLFFPLYQT